MVTSDEKRKDRQDCKLEEIQKLAAKQQVIYENEQVLLDVSALDLDLARVCDCICKLTDDDFKHSILYPTCPLWMDVYKLPFTSSSNWMGLLYIKLSLSRNCTKVVVFSFHQDR